jgi:hypothetical protein
MTRKCEIARKTKETKIALELNIDGTGTYDIKVPDLTGKPHRSDCPVKGHRKGDGFFKHDIDIKGF